MRKRTSAAIAICFSLMLCAGCGKTALVPGDSVIPPISAGDAIADSEKPGAGNSLYNFSNAIQPASSSSNMEYPIIGGSDLPVSICADNKYIYLLRRGDEEAGGEYGRIIEAYNVDNASLAGSISHESLASCSAFTVMDSNIYAYDVNSGKILLFSSGGSFLSAYDTGLAGIRVERMVAAKSRFIIMKTRENPGERSELAIYDIESDNIDVIDAESIFQQSSGTEADIAELCLSGGNTILIGSSTGRLYLYDCISKKVVRSCIFPSSSGYMEFDGNVLYYSSDAYVSLNPGNAANFSNISGPRLAGRMLINSEFTWPEDIGELDKWLLGDLPIPFANDGGRHYGMAQNNKYLFFLDLVPVQTEPSSTSGFTVYRIMK